jgi:hypothetical protein
VELSVHGELCRHEVAVLLHSGRRAPQEESLTKMVGGAADSCADAEEQLRRWAEMELPAGRGWGGGAAVSTRGRGGCLATQRPPACR